MAGKDIIIMKMKELRRIPVIHSIINKQVTQQEAANILGLSRRQIIRIVKDVKEKGDIALVHKSRGRPSNRARPADQKEKILQLCNTTYKGFGPTFAAEKLFEIDRLYIHPDTLRKWFIEADIEYKKRKAPKHRCWRPRRDSFGHMVQMDGSHHPWLENRGPECVLMGYIDDATGNAFGLFYEYEGRMPAMDSFRKYIKKYGIPQSIYIDMHPTYKSTKKPTLEDELNNQKALTQFARALTELGVDIIYAQSAPAKGRVERSFKTHQDRFVKEMRLKDITTIKEANKFAKSYYFPKHNRKFAVMAKDKANLHRPIPKGLDLDRIFCIKNKAALRKDFTIQYNNKFYQILDAPRTDKVQVEERLSGKVHIYHKDKELRYKIIDKRPQKPKALYKPRKKYIPPADHPYKLLYKKLKRRCA
ncbi:MAG TPA: ISNCY family transposase [Candidatus Omnitrophica bacterium]|nr:ISNCY family transposase [Candidatus Omnitrophota bacterium]